MSRVIAQQMALRTHHSQAIVSGALRTQVIGGSVAPTIVTCSTTPSISAAASAATANELVLQKIT